MTLELEEGQSNLRSRRRCQWPGTSRVVLKAVAFMGRWPVGDARVLAMGANAELLSYLVQNPHRTTVV